MPSVLLTVGLLLVACAGDYFNAGQQVTTPLLAMAHIQYTPAFSFLIFAVGAGMVLHHQRQSQPAEK